MKKEKTIRTYQRRTKSGKIVTVRQHTAKYDAAEALKEAAKKKGAGDELEALKKKPVDKPTEEEVAEFEKLLDSFPEELDERSRKMRLRQFMKAKGKKGRQAEIDETKWEIKEEKKARKVWKANEGFGKRLEKSYDKEHKNSVKDSKDPYSAHGFTKDDFNEWYEGTGSAADKKVAKALRKTLGRKAYDELSDLAADNYKKGGASSFFKKNVHSKTAETKTSNGMKKGAASAKRMTLDEYLGSKGLSSPVSDFMIDKTKLPHGLTQRGKEKLRKEADKAANEYQEKRAAAIKEYKKLVKEGKIVAPTSSEQLNKIAEGHPDNASTQAAKRVLEKRAAKTGKSGAKDSDLVEHYDQFNKKSMGKAVGDSFTFSEGRGKDKFTYDARFVTDGKGRYGYVVRDKEEGPDAKYYVGISDGYERHSQLPAGLRKAAEAQGLRFKNGEFVKKETKGDRAVARMHKLVNEALSSTTSDPKALKKQLGALIDYNGGPTNYGDKIGKRIDEIREQLGKRSSSKKRVDKKSDYDYETSMKNLENYFAEERRKIQK